MVHEHNRPVPDGDSVSAAQPAVEEDELLSLKDDSMDDLSDLESISDEQSDELSDEQSDERSDEQSDEQSDELSDVLWEELPGIHLIESVEQSGVSSPGQPDLDPGPASPEIVVDNADPLSAVLPIRTVLPDKCPVLIRRMRDDEISLTYREIEEAGRQGQGFGLQEWEDETEFREDIRGAHCLAVADAESDELLASLVLAISRFYRGQDCADPYIVVRPSCRGRGLGDFCLSWSVQLSKLAGFLAMYVDCFSTNVAMIKILRRSPFSFEQVGCLPLGGRLAGGIMAQTLIFFLDLANVDVFQPIHPITQP